MHNKRLMSVHAIYSSTLRYLTTLLTPHYIYQIIARMHLYYGQYLYYVFVLLATPDGFADMRYSHESGYDLSRVSSR